MPIVGLGLGGNMQPIILAMQNAVSPREIGVATSSVTFFRQMGGTLGAAVFLSVLFTTAAGQDRRRVPGRQGTPEFAAARRRTRTRRRTLQAAGGQRRPQRHVVHLAAGPGASRTRSRSASPTR